MLDAGIPSPEVEMLSHDLGPLLKSARQQLGMSREALAQSAGVSMRLVAEFERGQRSNVSLESALRLLKSVGITVVARAPHGPAARHGRGATSTSETLAILRSRLDHCLGGLRLSPRSPTRHTSSRPADVRIPASRGRSAPEHEGERRWRVQRRAVAGLRRLHRMPQRTEGRFRPRGRVCAWRARGRTGDWRHRCRPPPITRSSRRTSSPSSASRPIGLICSMRLMA